MGRRCFRTIPLDLRWMVQVRRRDIQPSFILLTCAAFRLIRFSGQQHGHPRRSSSGRATPGACWSLYVSAVVWQCAQLAFELRTLRLQRAIVSPARRQHQRVDAEDPVKTPLLTTVLASTRGVNSARQRTASTYGVNSWRQLVASTRRYYAAT